MELENVLEKVKEIKNKGKNFWTTKPERKLLVEEVERLREKKMPYKKISKRLGIGSTTARDYMNRKKSKKVRRNDDFVGGKPTETVKPAKPTEFKINSEKGVVIEFKITIK
jgi:DNA invertase Pin-like site-specific DNA recombinase